MRVVGRVLLRVRQKRGNARILVGKACKIISNSTGLLGSDTKERWGKVRAGTRKIEKIVLRNGRSKGASRKLQDL